MGPATCQNRRLPTNSLEEAKLSTPKCFWHSPRKMNYVIVHAIGGMMRAVEDRELQEQA